MNKKEFEKRIKMGQEDPAMGGMPIEEEMVPPMEEPLPPTPDITEGPSMSDLGAELGAQIGAELGALMESKLGKGKEIRGKEERF